MLAHRYLLSTLTIELIFRCCHQGGLPREASVVCRMLIPHIYGLCPSFVKRVVSHRNAAWVGHQRNLYGPCHNTEKLLRATVGRVVEGYPLEED